MKLPAILCASALAACAATPPPEPRVVTRTVEVPVAVRCKPNLGPAPAYPDSDASIASAGDVFDLAKLYRAGRALRNAWIAQLEAAVKGCSGEGAPHEP